MPRTKNGFWWRWSDIANLPQLTYKELLSTLKHFGHILRGEGSPIIIGISRKGNSFTVHHHQSRKVTPSKLAKILKHLDVTQAEFLEWYKN